MKTHKKQILTAFFAAILTVGYSSQANAWFFKTDADVETSRNSNNDSSRKDSNNDSSRTHSGNTTTRDAHNTADAYNTSNSNNKDNINTTGDVWTTSMDRINSPDLEGTMNTLGDRFQSHNVGGNISNSNLADINAGNTNVHFGGQNNFDSNYDSNNDTQGGKSYGGNGSSIANNKAKAKGNSRAKTKPKTKGKVKVKKGGEAQGHNVHASSSSRTYNDATANQQSAGYGGVSDASGGDAYSSQSFDNAHVDLGDTFGDNSLFDASIQQTITFGDVNMGGK